MYNMSKNIYIHCGMAQYTHYVITWPPFLEWWEHLKSTGKEREGDVWEKERERWEVHLAVLCTSLICCGTARGYSPGHQHHVLGFPVLRAKKKNLVYTLLLTIVARLYNVYLYLCICGGLVPKPPPPWIPKSKCAHNSCKMVQYLHRNYAHPPIYCEQSLHHL
jgi:hypothetical protein